MMQSMNQHPQAGMDFVGAKDQAAGGMRSLRNDMFQRMFELRQRGMRNEARDGKKDRRMGVISATLGAAGRMPWGGKGAPPQQAPIFDVPLDAAPLNAPPMPFQDPWRTRRPYEGSSLA